MEISPECLKFCSIQTENRKFHVAPKYAADLREGARECACKYLFRYSSTLKGVPVHINKINILGNNVDDTPNSAEIIYDNPCIHVPVSISWSIFAPTPNTTLKGIVNIISREHISIVIFDFFSAIIYAPHMRETCVWEEDEGEEAEYWFDRRLNRSISVGNEISFAVLETLIDGDVMTIIGSLDKLK